MKFSEMTKPVEVLLIEASLKTGNTSPKKIGGNGTLKNFYRVCNHQEALSFLHQEGAYQTAPRPDIIVIDSNLSSPNAFQLLTQIKKDEVGQKIPVVVCTPSEFFHSFHSYCYVTTPVSTEEAFSLVQFIKSCCLTPKNIPTEEKGRSRH